MEHDGNDTLSFANCFRILMRIQFMCIFCLCAMHVENWTRFRYFTFNYKLFHRMLERITVLTYISISITIDMAYNEHILVLYQVFDHFIYNFIINISVSDEVPTCYVDTHIHTKPFDEVRGKCFIKIVRQNIAAFEGILHSMDETVKRFPMKLFQRNEILISNGNPLNASTKRYRFIHTHFYVIK